MIHITIKKFDKMKPRRIFGWNPSHERWNRWRGTRILNVYTRIYTSFFVYAGLSAGWVAGFAGIL